MGSPHTITDVATLRESVGEEIPGLHEKVIDHIDDFARAFIEMSPFVVMSTADDAGRVDASPKGDAPGFVVVEDQHTLLIPDRRGNKLAYGHQNILANPHVGLLFVIPGTPETLRINGRAELTADPALKEQMASRGKDAVLAVRVYVEECFFHCGKAFIRANLWQHEQWPERHRVSFGDMWKARKGVTQEEAGAIDDAIETDYKENL